MDARSYIAIGSYVGNREYGSNNPIIITCGFRPKMVLFCVNGVVYNYNSVTSDYIGTPILGWIDGITEVKEYFPPDNDTILFFTQLDNGLSFFSDRPYNNHNGITYHYIAFG